MRHKKLSEPVLTRLSLADYGKFEKLREKQRMTSSELARELMSKSLAEVQING